MVEKQYPHSTDWTRPIAARDGIFVVVLLIEPLVPFTDIGILTVFTNGHVDPLGVGATHCVYMYDGYSYWKPERTI